MTLESLQEMAPAIAKRVEYVPNADMGTFEAISCGIVFIMAWWSAHAHVVFKNLAHVLSELDPEGRLPHKLHLQ